MTTFVGRKLISALHLGRPASLVVDGYVFCVRARADVDVDRCYGCPTFVDAFTDADGNERIRCRD